MHDIVKNLLGANDYSELTEVSNDKVRAFVSTTFNDFILVAEYSVSDLTSYNTSPLTTKVMEAFDKLCNIKPEALKDTSLVICLKITRPEEQDESKNAILAVEEDAYGFRKFVLVYSNTSIQGISQIQASALNEAIYEKLRSGFSAFTTPRPAQPAFTEYDVILQLFVKLPFMRLQTGASDESLESIKTFLNQKLGSQRDVIRFVREVSEEYSRIVDSFTNNSSEKSQDYDAQIEELLSKEYVKDLSAPTGGHTE